MNTYWEAFLDNYPWASKLQLIDALEFFWYFCNQQTTNFSIVVPMMHERISKQGEASK